MALDGWEKQESGWYTHGTRGGICRETTATARSRGLPRGGWYLYALRGEMTLGPYRTLAAAKRAARKQEG